MIWCILKQYSILTRWVFTYYYWPFLKGKGIIVLNFVVKNPNKIFICIRRLLHSEKLLPQGHPCLRLRVTGEAHTLLPKVFSVLRSRPEADDSLIGGMYLLTFVEVHVRCERGYFLLSSFKAKRHWALRTLRYRAVFKKPYGTACNYINISNEPPPNYYSVLAALSLQ